MKTDKIQGHDPFQARKYRQESIWKLVALVTAGVILLSAVPYLDKPTPGGVLLFIPPVMSCWLIVYVLFKIRKYFLLFDDLEQHRAGVNERGLTVELGAITYIVMLGVLAFLHFLLLAATEFSYA